MMPRLHLVLLSYVQVCVGSSGEGEGKASIDFTKYHSLDEIYDYLDAVAESYDGTAEVHEMGQTFESRPMKVLCLTKSGKGSSSARNVVFEGGLHAREWISPSSLTYIIQKVVDEGDRYAEELNLYFIPVANPDGYEYTRTGAPGSPIRNWRKNRNNGTESTASACGNPSHTDTFGVDLNRNFGFKWNVTAGTADVCREDYGGPEAWSEPESRNIRDFYKSIDPLPELAMAVHSFQQSISYGYGYAKDTYPKEHELIKKLCFGSARVTSAVNGLNYTCRGDSFWPTSGSSDDWYNSLETKVVLLLELRDMGQYGFELPPDQIVPAGEETWAMAKYLMDYLLDGVVPEGSGEGEKGGGETGRKEGEGEGESEGGEGEGEGEGEGKAKGSGKGGSISDRMGVARGKGAEEAEEEGGGGESPAGGAGRYWPLKAPPYKTANSAN